MASNINPNNIDGAYPVAGQDNDSQGFRTNFTNIKNNFVNSKSEIEDLQSKVIVKSALTGTTVNNNMGGTVFQSAEIRDLRETRVDFGTTSGTLALDHTAAPNYTVTTSGSVSLSFTGFPAAGKVGRIRFEITVSSVDPLDPHTMILPASVNKGTKGIAGLNNTTVTFNETGSYLFEFWTDDGGTTVHIEDKTRNRSYFHTGQVQLQQRSPSNVGAAGDVAGMFALDSSYMYICTGTYDGSTVIWKRVSFGSY
jgi:hypothetical protein